MKKKNFMRNNLTEKVLIKHFLLIMLMTFILLFTYTFCSIAGLNYKQNIRTAINKHNAVLSEVLYGIEDQIDYLLIYNSEVNKTGKETVVEIVQQQKKTITGIVVDINEQVIIGANIIEVGTTNGSITDIDGRFSLNVENDAIISVSYIGYIEQDINTAEGNYFKIVLEEDTKALDEVIVVGYGMQKKSDITGTVASLNQERLDMIPNMNIAQAIQGSIPGVMIQTSSAGASSSEAILIRGRNSIAASNNPLIVVDGIPYEGNIRDLNPNDVASIEILKDASSASIYGSRGSNGVILITSKSGKAGELKLSYNGNYSIQKPINLLDHMNGAEFYEFKIERTPQYMTSAEQEIYESGEWVDWYDEILRNGFSQDHNLSISGGTQSTKFYISGGLLNVDGITLNDKYTRAISRINVETALKHWLTIGTKTQLSYEDRSGASPSWSDAYSSNPLVRAYDENGNITVYPWEGMPNESNPLQQLLFDDTDESYQILTNNFAIFKIPKIEGLEYRINAGFNFRFADRAVYKGRNTHDGITVNGSAETSRSRFNSTVLENILSYNNNFKKNNIFITALYSFEGNKNSVHSLTASGFENDILKYYAAKQANFISPNYSIVESHLVSQMLRFNYSYDSRYLLTLTGRRDGFSGFGKSSKWGFFPSFALGWNLQNETFMNNNNLFSELKLRASYGLNGNQAVGSYQSITRLSEFHYVDSKTTASGYLPSVLGDSDLGWESSKTLNFGIDFGLLRNRISGDFNVYKTNTTDLLLERTISSIHGITSITTNIGEVKNEGVELSINSRNIANPSFRWNTYLNLAFTKNKIISLYGILNDSGQEIDDLANNWFIGQPIRTNYDFEVIGTWQLNEVDEAAKWNSQPGGVKFDDVNSDYKLDDNDRKFLGQQDPKFIWGMTNSFFYNNFGLSIFLHGVHGVTRQNGIMHDHVLGDVRNNTLKKNWWTPENPTNDWYANRVNADVMGGILARTRIYQNASFIRVKDIVLSYDFSNINLLGLLDNFKVFLTGRNLFTFTKWTGLDPELNSQTNIPLQREIILGVDINF